MIIPLRLQAGATAQVVRGCRAFRVDAPSFGGTWQLDSGQPMTLLGGQLVELQPLHGGSEPPLGNQIVALNRAISGLTTAVTGFAANPHVEMGGSPKIYPDVAFTPGPTSILLVLCDIDDGNQYVSGTLGGSLSPTAQEGDLPPSFASLTGNVLGEIGTPVLFRDVNTGKLTIPYTNASTGAINVSITSLPQSDQQLFDSTPAAGAAVTSGTLGGPGTSQWRDIIVRIAGLTAPSTRILTFNGVRSDASVVAMYVAPAFGAAITDAEFGAGPGALVPATPTGAASVGLSFGAPIPEQWQVVLSAGGATDNPRVTIWGRQQT